MGSNAESIISTGIGTANLLTGVFSSDESIISALSRIGLYAGDPFYCVVQFELSGSYRDSIAALPQDYLSTTRALTADTEQSLGGALPDGCGVRSVSMGSSICALLLSTGKEARFPGVPLDSSTLSAARAAIEHIRENYDPGACAYVSNYSPGVSGPRTAYGQIEELRYYMHLFDRRETLVTFESLSQDHHRSIEDLVTAEVWEGRLLSAIQVNDFASALSLINLFIDEQFVFGRLRLQEAQVRYHSLINNILHLLDRMWITGGDEYFHKYNPSFRLFERAHSIYALRDLINLIFREYGDYMSGLKATGGESIPKWCVQLHDYILSSYKDPELNSSSAADYIGLNPAYAARVFRSYYGVSILEYINRLRIAEAKRLLNDGVRLTEAAVSSGYGNLPRMNRAFQRYEGTSPKENSKQLSP